MHPLNAAIRMLGYPSRIEGTSRVSTNMGGMQYDHLIDALKFMLKEGANPNFMVFDKYADSPVPLFHSVVKLMTTNGQCFGTEAGHQRLTNIVQAFIDAGADVNAQVCVFLLLLCLLGGEHILSVSPAHKQHR